MPIQFNDNVSNNSPRLLEAKSAKIVSGTSVPFTSVAEANAATPSAYRCRALFKFVDDGSGLKPYWYKDGTADNQLVLFSAGGGGTSATLSDILTNGNDASGLSAIGFNNVISSKLSSPIMSIKNTGSLNSTAVSNIIYNDTGVSDGNIYQITLPNKGGVVAVTSDINTYTFSAAFVVTGSNGNYNIDLAGATGSPQDFGYITGNI